MTNKKSKLNCPYCNHPSLMDHTGDRVSFRVTCASKLCYATGPAGLSEEEAKRKFGNKIQNYLELPKQCIFCGKSKFTIDSNGRIYKSRCVNCNASGPIADTEEEAKERITERP